MIHVFHDVCILCREFLVDAKTYASFDIKDLDFPVHLKCWMTRSCGRTDMKFDSYADWKNFAGDEWDLMEHSYVNYVGGKEYYLDGRFHRIGGPAFVGGDGSEGFWINGKSYSKASYVPAEADFIREHSKLPVDDKRSIGGNQ